MYKVSSRWPHQSSIKIEWNIGKRCNYDCSYCPPIIHDNTSRHTNIEILKSTIDKLIKLNKPLRLSFTGGEPCIHPKFNELITYAKKEQIQWISVTTNGTRTAKFYSDILVNQYIFSLHLEYDWQRVFNTLLHIHKTTDIKIIAQIMCHHNHFDSAKILFDKCLDEDIPFTLRRIRWTDGDHDVFNDTKYNQIYLDWIKEHEATIIGNCIIDDIRVIHANDIIKLHLNKYKNWLCNAGIESLMINWDGEVYRATCRVGDSIGNIYNNDFEQPKNPINCTRNFCTCSADIPITKICI
jgi:MoaA/NifB/PqqE/SkfB family radical SAM enzyme